MDEKCPKKCIIEGDNEADKKPKKPGSSKGKVKAKREKKSKKNPYELLSKVIQVSRGQRKGNIEACWVIRGDSTQGRCEFIIELGENLQ
ncbi:hypothetical protein J1N35_014522 [Gossypium stocksii]|uniref:Uncharacterized protein n=1 Tax=Gossypium stocksii TaxID=47602 RepID=A0A9D3VW87_9ROSI|nr:hypothetical protein J1N35_014522 [Gossypium stocksii]